MKVCSNVALGKIVAALVLAGASVPAAQADVVIDGTIYQKIGGPTNVDGTTIDFFSVTLASDGVLEVDMLASESVTGSLAAHPLAFYDRNGDGEITALNGHLRLFQGTTDYEIGDNSAQYKLPAVSRGWGDGSISANDSYMLVYLLAGTYTLAVGDSSVQTADLTTHFNTGDTLSDKQTHADYRLTIRAFDDFDHDANGYPIPGNPIGLTVTAVPVPAAAWLFGSAASALGFLTRRRRQA